MKLISHVRPPRPERHGDADTQRELSMQRNSIDDADASLRYLQRRLDVIQHRTDR